MNGSAIWMLSGAGAMYCLSIALPVGGLLVGVLLLATRCVLRRYPPVWKAAAATLAWLPLVAIVVLILACIWGPTA